MGEIEPKKRFNVTLDLGNIIQISLLLIAIVAFGTRVESHLGDTQIHQTAEEKARAFDDRFNLRVEPLLIEIRNLKREIERLNTQLAYERKD